MARRGEVVGADRLQHGVGRASAEHELGWLSIGLEWVLGKKILVVRMAEQVRQKWRGMTVAFEVGLKAKVEEAAVRETCWRRLVGQGLCEIVGEATCYAKFDGLAVVGLAVVEVLVLEEEIARDSVSPRSN